MGMSATATASWKLTPEYKAITAIRTLAMDAVQQANSGHPGTPVSMAPVAYTLWQHFLRFDPADPRWPNRDRFVLSIGHASMLLYALLHLTRTQSVNARGELVPEPAVSLDEIKRFRQWDSRTPGHPEYGLTPGVETTTGPLGSGVANSVGMAIASRWLAARYNKPGCDLFNYDVYALAGDGCMMEGISGEAASVAGHLRLSNLCWIYDNNHITIEGKTSLAFSEDVATRFLGYRWNVTRVADANDLDMLARAFQTFKATTDRPTLIIVDSHIAWGVPGKQDHHSAHGEPLGADKVKAAKEFYGCPNPDGKFEQCLFDGVYDTFQEGVGKRGREAHASWNTLFAEYRKQYPDLAEQIERMQKRQLPDGWDRNLPSFPADAKGVASRDSSGKVLNALAQNIPWLLGGAADLAPSTKTLLTFEGAGNFQAESYGGRNFHFGIREHAMGAIINGMALCKLRPYGSSFLIFSDYGRPQIRLGAIMELPVIYVYTHDSIGVGEDGPTHQPIEQLASLRAIPNLIVLRPGDANEVVEAWKAAIQSTHHPMLLALTRQAIPTFDRTRYASAAGVARGAYVLADAPDGKPEVLLLATGSELSLCVEAYEKLSSEGVKARVVSMPSWELFEQTCAREPGYREQVLPGAVKARVAVEMATTFGWSQYVGLDGAVIGMHRFGASAPVKELQKQFGFTADHVVAAAREQLALRRRLA